MKKIVCKLLVIRSQYHPFGSLAKGRSFSLDNYRYGFNDKESDDETYGDGGEQDYGMRIYDTRLGRFLSIDPITKNFPMLSPYQFSSNRPLDGVDMDGLEYVTVHVLINEDGTHTEMSRVNHYQVMTDADVQRVHGDVKKFYKEYSAPFEAEGRGVKFVYYKVDENGKPQATGETKWESKQESGPFAGDMFRHGIWAGEGGITISGSDPDVYPNADASFGFIDEIDRLAKAHDLFYDYPGYQDGDSRKNNLTKEAIDADKAFLNGVREYVRKYDEAKKAGTEYIDEVTGRPVSAEAIRTARLAIILFNHDINKKEKKLEKQQKAEAKKKK